jgi:hypothetical protein
LNALDDLGDIEKQVQIVCDEHLVLHVAVLAYGFDRVPDLID